MPGQQTQIFIPMDLLQSNLLFIVLQLPSMDPKLAISPLSSAPTLRLAICSNRCAGKRIHRTQEAKFHLPRTKHLFESPPELPLSPSQEKVLGCWRSKE